MRKLKTIEIASQELEALACDRYGRETKHSEAEELQEYLQIDYHAGFGSVVFPDESRITGDFCQYCVKELLGDYLTVVDFPTSSDNIANPVLGNWKP